MLKNNVKSLKTSNYYKVLIIKTTQFYTENDREIKDTEDRNNPL